MVTAVYSNCFWLPRSLRLVPECRVEKPVACVCTSLAFIVVVGHPERHETNTPVLFETCSELALSNGFSLSYSSHNDYLHRGAQFTNLPDTPSILSNQA